MLAAQCVVMGCRSCLQSLTLFLGKHLPHHMRPDAELLAGGIAPLTRLSELRLIDCYLLEVPAQVGCLLRPTKTDQQHDRRL